MDTKSKQVRRHIVTQKEIKKALGFGENENITGIGLYSGRSPNQEKENAPKDDEEYYITTEEGDLEVKEHEE